MIERKILCCVDRNVINTDVMKNITDAPQNIKDSAIIWTKNSISGENSKGNKIINRGSCPSMLTEPLSIIAKART